MGKIVKYCSNCEESFAEKFSFCPNCAQPMTAFEMNPVSGSGGETVVGKQAGQTIIESKKPVEDENILEIPAEEPIVETAPEPVVAAPTVVQTTPKIESEKIGDTKIFTASNQTQTYNLADIEELGTIDELKAQEPKEEEIFDEPETKTFAAAAANGNGNGNYKTEDFQTNYSSVKQNDDDGFHITVIEEKNSKQRNSLLLGTLALMIITVLGSTVYSIFNKDIGIGEIGGGDLVAFVPNIDEVPPVVDEPPPPQADPGKGGGGGGGGRKDDAPISKGELPPQFKDKPLLTPSKEDISVSKPELAVMRATRGPDDIIPKKRSATNGDPNATSTTPSNGLSADNLGMGQNGSGGIGNNGRDGYGANGTGGQGLSRGGKYGNNDGPGGGGSEPPPPPKAPEPKPVGPTEAIKILSRPQPRYTDAARTNNVTGTVTLKVTFMANGQIGSVAPVSGLPYGLTEQAIAAAKSIRFEPAKRGGVPYSVSKTVTYNFTIY